MRIQPLFTGLFSVLTTQSYLESELFPIPMSRLDLPADFVRILEWQEHYAEHGGLFKIYSASLPEVDNRSYPGNYPAWIFTGITPHTLPQSVGVKRLQTFCRRPAVKSRYDHTSLL